MIAKRMLFLCLRTMRRLMRTFSPPLATGVMLGCSTIVGAQVVGHAAYTVHGVVFDSVAGAPLTGARVELARRSGVAAPFTTRTDSRGFYRFEGVPAGQFVIGFYHDQLTLLGLDAPTRGLDVERDTVVTVDLAIPSSQMIRRLRCGIDHDGPSAGMLVGYLREAATGLPMQRPMLRLYASANAADTGGAAPSLPLAQPQIEADGTMLACNLPTERDLQVEVTAPGHLPIRGPIGKIPSNGIKQLDLGLVDSSARVGGARVRGRVVDSAGAAILSGRVLVPLLGRETRLQSGSFVLDSMPRGSWVIEVRAIGYAAASAIADASDRTAPPIELRIGAPLVQLDAVTVVGQRGSESSLLDDILRRKRLAIGSVFLPDSPALKSATFISDVMKDARGFAYRGRTSITGRVTREGVRCGFIAVYVDGLLQPGGFEEVDNSVAPNHVLAVETFPDLRMAPVQYRAEKFVLGTKNAYCALVLVWTRHAR